MMGRRAPSAPLPPMRFPGGRCIPIAGGRQSLMCAWLRRLSVPQRAQRSYSGASSKFVMGMHAWMRGRGRCGAATCCMMV